MKITIQGHPTRGKEVIQIFENLGGINTWNYLGNNPDYYYKLHENSIVCSSIKIGNYKYYTLEEFEQEFPFKIGDKVIYSYAPIIIGTVVDIKFDDHIPYRVDIMGKIYTCGTAALKLYKEMKEERNITLTLDKAKEWYKKGGDLKQVALQAFTEKELNPLPKSWEEYCRKHGSICLSTRYTSISSKYDAIIKLEQLRDCWRQGWVQTPTDTGYRICKLLTGGYGVMAIGSCEYFLTFSTKEIAEEFLKCFKDLIEKAGDLI